MAAVTAVIVGLVGKTALPPLAPWLPALYASLGQSAFVAYQTTYYVFMLVLGASLMLYLVGLLGGSWAVYGIVGGLLSLIMVVGLVREAVTLRGFLAMSSIINLGLLSFVLL